MSKRYIIDSSFEFWPTTCQLVVLGIENITISLNIPASRCLELLIERRFELVLQHDFYDYVWGEEGNEVSVNTLYQNIALLRKSLKSISENYGVMVITVPRQGFQFNQIFTILEQSSTEKMAQQPSVVPAETRISKADNEAQANFSSPQSYGKLKWPPILLAIIATALTATVMIYYFLAHDDPLPLNSYSLYPIESECITYTTPNTIDISRRVKIIKALGVDCKNTPYLYISSFGYSTRTSAIACAQPIGGIPSPSCITYNFIGGR